MDFQTKINIQTSSFKIAHQDKLLLLGSCFTENIGYYLKQYQFQVTINPFGIIYNPVSIFNNLKHIVDKKVYAENDLMFHNELYISLDHHGVFSGMDKNKVLANINAVIKKTYDDFTESKFVVITFGTSFVYNYVPQNKIAANCHKIPNNEFEKKLLTIDAIKEAFNTVKNQLKDKTVLFTVSPVRHWRDGAVENQRSKSILTESIHQLILENENCFYFPAYEIMMDELRDYRFYAEDMLHPNTVAVKYIWERFAETYFDINTTEINSRIEKINLLLQHRMKNPSGKTQADFVQKIIDTISEFNKRYPEVETKF